MLLVFTLTVAAIFGLLLLSEAWWRKRRPSDEFSRKFIHIFVGSFAAFWPFFLHWNYIILLSLAFVVVVIASKRLHIFQSIHAVERPTWGEVFFALSVGILALMTHQPWIYATALLHMSLADGLAAVCGVTWGRRTQYRIFGHAKSVVGSAAFFTVSVGLLFLYNQYGPTPLHVPTLLGLALLATVVENIAGYGLDNLFIPVVIGVVLTRLQ